MQVNLDTFDEVAKDYRFYEDPGDEFRNPPDGVRTVKQTNKNLKLFGWVVFLQVNLANQFPNQVLLPLWNFAVEDVVGLEVTQLQWSSKYLGKTILQI